jgi:CubicO group peptidase (beta-lactamase class C family)
MLTGCTVSKKPVNQPNSTSPNDSIEQKVSNIDAYLTASGVTGGLLIARNGIILLSKGYGWANEEAKTPITPNSIFNIGSVTKQFTGAAILKLEEQRKLKTTDTITSFLKMCPQIKKI